MCFETYMEAHDKVPVIFKKIFLQLIEVTDLIKNSIFHYEPKLAASQKYMNYQITWHFQ